MKTELLTLSHPIQPLIPVTQSFPLRCSDAPHGPSAALSTAAIQALAIFHLVEIFPFFVNANILHGIQSTIAIWNAMQGQAILCPEFPSVTLHASLQTWNVEVLAALSCAGDKAHALCNGVGVPDAALAAPPLFCDPIILQDRS